MKQSDYEMILACIAHGAPALADRLVNSLNTLIETNNTTTNELKATKAELEKHEAAKKDAEKATNEVANKQPINKVK